MKTRIDGMAMIIPLFEQAEAVQGGAAVDEAAIDEVFAQWAEPAPGPTVAERCRSRRKGGSGWAASRRLLGAGSYSHRLPRRSALARDRLHCVDRVAPQCAPARWSDQHG